MNGMRLAGKVAIITGAASGMGRAMSLLFSNEGAKITVVDIAEDRGRAVVDEIKKKGSEAIFVKADVGSIQDAERAVKKCGEMFGGVDILVNNAGTNPRGTVVTTSEEEWNRVISVNLDAAFRFSKYAIPEMIRRGGGSIVNIASVNGLVAFENEAAYDASKGGLVMLTRSMAADHAKDKVRVNCICPGITDTPMFKRTVSSYSDQEAFLEKARKMHPLGRLGKPEDIAHAALFLVSDESSFITGAILPVDGGYTIL